MVILSGHLNSIERRIGSMPRREKNIYKRKDGRWEGRYPKNRDDKGKIIYGSIYGKKYQDVKEKLSLISKNEQEKIVLSKKDYKFQEILLMWLHANSIRYKGATENKYQYLIETHIIPKLGNVKLSQISTTMINSFLLEKMENGRLDNTGGLSASYVRSIMLIINSALKFAANEQLCLPLKNPIYKPVCYKKEFPILDKEVQKKLEKFLMKELNPSKAGIFISLHTGLRIGEICALSWDDIDISKEIIHVRHTIARVKDKNSANKNATKLVIDTPKTKSSIRDIPISSRLLPIIMQLKKISVSEYLCSCNQVFVSPRTFEYRYHKLLNECGIPSINYHALRHTFATRCIEAGVDVKSLSEILGHSNVSITLNTYVHSSMELKRCQLEKMSNGFIENGQEDGQFF